ncbi:MAG TPA: hypothetical protein VKF81_04425 [Blastocatellia bacterium]|nr:hypothetical protein [Blastocatellia bacterium]
MGREGGMMRTIIRLTSIAAAITLAVGTIAIAAPKAQRANKYFTVAGTVIRIDKQNRTLLVADRRSEKLYLIEVPEGATFKITFGRYMRMARPEFGDVIARERVEIRCFRTDAEHLARLDDGRVAVRLIAAN